MNQIKSKSTMIYFPLPEDLETQIETLSLKLKEKYPENTYNPRFNNKWFGHLALYLSPMPVSNLEKIIYVAKNVTLDFPPLDISTEKLSMGDSIYLYLEIDKNSKKACEILHEKFIHELMPLRDSTIKSKYLQKWDTFTTEEKMRIKNTGLPYIYVPHITVGVFNDLKNAYTDAINLGIPKQQFRVNELRVMISDEFNKEIVLSQQLKDPHNL